MTLQSSVKNHSLTPKAHSITNFLTEKLPKEDHIGNKLANITQNMQIKCDQEVQTHHEENKEMEVQADIQTDDSSELSTNSNDQEKDKFWIEYRDFIDKGVPEGWKSVEGRVWNHKPKKILMHFLDVS
jgi:hypothetical protein